MPQDTFVIEAFIKTPIVMSERMVFLQGTTQEAITKTVDIKGDLNKPLTLEPVDFTLVKKVRFTIEEVAREKHYRVSFTSIPNGQPLPRTLSSRQATLKNRNS
jgi:hypothetical protein